MLVDVELAALVVAFAAVGVSVFVAWRTGKDQRIGRTVDLYNEIYQESTAVDTAMVARKVLHQFGFHGSLDATPADERSAVARYLNGLELLGTAHTVGALDKRTVRLLLGLRTWNDWEHASAYVEAYRESIGDEKYLEHFELLARENQPKARPSRAEP